MHAKVITKRVVNGRAKKMTTFLNTAGGQEIR